MNRWCWINNYSQSSTKGTPWTYYAGTSTYSQSSMTETPWTYNAGSTTYNRPSTTRMNEWYECLTTPQHKKSITRSPWTYHAGSTTYSQSSITETPWTYDAGSPTIVDHPRLESTMLEQQLRVDHPRKIPMNVQCWINNWESTIHERSPRTNATGATPRTLKKVFRTKILRLKTDDSRPTRTNTAHRPRRDATRCA